MVDQANRVVGSGAVFRVVPGRVADVSSGVDIAAAGVGLANYAVSNSRGSVTVGGSGDWISQRSTPDRTSSVSFTVPESDVVDPLFTDKALRYVTGRLSPQGEGAGSRWSQAVFALQVTETGPNTGPVTLAVTLDVDGDITTGTH